MVFVFLILFITAIILWVANRKDEATRWAVFFLLCGSGGSLGVTIQYSILPSLDRYEIGYAFLNEMLYRVQIYSSFLNQICFPYAVLMYAIVAYGRVQLHTKRLLMYTLLVPVLVMFVTTPTINNKIRIDYPLILIWVIPYLLLACFLLVFAYVKETSRGRKINRLRTVIIIVPTVLGILFLNYISKALQLGIPLFRYLSVFVGFSFVMFVVFAFVHGALGVRLRFERQRLDTAMRAMSSGASFVNHAIKQEMGKIKIVAEQVQTLAATNEQREIRRYAGFIQDGAEHLLDISSRLRNQFRDFELQEGTHSVEALIENNLPMVSPLLDKKSIRVIRERYPPINLLCDNVLIREVLINVWTNAIEAMSKGGQLYIAVYGTKRWLTIEIKDEGHGIPKEHRQRLIEPFFSTKQDKGNMGLGLSYCYNVMQKHGGELNIDSEERIGTTVTLLFPHKRVLRMA